MTPPLWAAVGSITVAIIPPVHATFVKATPLVSAIESVAGISIPIKLIALGAYFLPPKASTTSAEQMPGASRTVWAAVLSRMVFSPIPLYGILAALTLGTLVVIFDDPIFLLAMVLLAGGPTALTIAQLTSAASPQFEKIISRVIFLSYVVFLLLLTVVGTVLSIIVSTTPVRPRPERPRLSTRSVPPHRWRHNDTRGDGRGSPLPQDWAHGLPTAPVHLSPLQPHRGCRGPPAEKRLRRGRLARERQEPDQWSADRRLAQHLRLHGALLDERAKEFGEPTLYEEFCARDLDK